MDLALEHSPTPAIQIWREVEGLRWLRNAACRAWQVTAQWTDDQWLDLSRHILEHEFRQDDRPTTGLYRQPGQVAGLRTTLHWTLVPASRGQLAWLSLSPAAEGNVPSGGGSAGEAHTQSFSDRRAQVAAQMAGFGLWHVDAVTDEVRWDAQMYRLRGLDPDDPRPVSDLRRISMPAEDLAALMSYHDNDAQRARAGLLPADFVSDWTEFRVILPNGHIRWLASRSIVSRENGSVPTLMGVQWDITDQKRAEELKRERFVAEEANLTKRRFLANMSHEIRTPLNGVLGMMHLALQSGLQGRQREYIVKAERAAQTLLGIIGDILDFSKIEAGKIEFARSPFALDEVLDTVANVIGVQAEAKGLELVIDRAPDVPGALMGDALRLGQVLINLCNNAVKFTDRGEIELQVDLLERTADAVQLRFRVRDTGIGIPEDSMHKLFRPFEQLDGAATRRLGGTGLGLVISRHLAEQMGGGIDATSVAGAGSTFTVTARFALQADQPSAIPRSFGKRVRIGEDDSRAAQWNAALTVSPHEPTERDRAGLAGRRVLLVEDNLLNQELAIELLRDVGMVVSVASDGAQAIEALADEPFDIVLMDCRMPVMDGWKATRVIRTMPRFQGLPIIAMTANAMIGDRDEALASGMNDHLVKPIDVNALYETLLRWTGTPVTDRPVWPRT